MSNFMLRNLIASAAISLAGSPLFAFCSGPSYFDGLSADATAQLQKDANKVAFGEGTVWIATKGGRAVTIVGTVHVFDPRLKPLMARIAPSVQSAKLILLEATADEEAALKAYMAANPALFLNADGPTLPEVLPPETWNTLMEALRARNIPPFLAAKFQPWYLIMTLSIPPCVMDDMAAGRRGLDHMIMDEAAALDVPMQALEPFDTLIDVMQNVTAQEQLDMLTLTAANIDNQQALFVGMGDSYFDGDIGALISLNRHIAQNLDGLDPAEGLAMTLEAEEAIIVRRNLAWMPVIDAATQAHSSVMLAVGAAHLPDDQGLLALLAADGWTITPF